MEILNNTPTEKKRKCCANWDSLEKNLLRSIIKEFVTVIENKNTDTNTNKAMNIAWQKIAERFNELNSRNRTIVEIKQQWRTTKLDAKKKLSNFKRERNGTEGGQKPSSPDPDTNEIIEMIPQEFKVDSNKFALVPKYRYDAYRESRCPFYGALDEPFVYYAAVPNSNKNNRYKRNPNVFVRAFRWYTRDLVDNKKETLHQNEEARDADFARWLDEKYEEYLKQNISDHDSESELPTTSRYVRECESCTRNKRKRDIKPVKYILKPQCLSEATSECGPQFIPPYRKSSNATFVVKSQSSSVKTYKQPKVEDNNFDGSSKASIPKEKMNRNTTTTQTEKKRADLVKEKVEVELIGRSHNTMASQCGNSFIACPECVHKFVRKVAEMQPSLTVMEQSYQNRDKMFRARDGTQIQPSSTVKEPPYQSRGQMFRARDGTQMHPSTTLKEQPYQNQDQVVKARDGTQMQNKRPNKLSTRNKYRNVTCECEGEKTHPSTFVNPIQCYCPSNESMKIKPPEIDNFRTPEKWIGNDTGQSQSQSYTQNVGTNGKIGATARQLNERSGENCCPCCPVENNKAESETATDSRRPTNNTFSSNRKQSLKNQIYYTLTKHNFTNASTGRASQVDQGNWSSYLQQTTATGISHSCNENNAQTSDHSIILRPYVDYPLYLRISCADKLHRDDFCDCNQECM